MAKKETGLSKVKTDRQSTLLKFYATPTHPFNHIKINTMTYLPTFRATAAIMASLLILSACKGGARNASESDSIIEMTSTETDFGDQEIMIGRPLSMNRVGDFLLILDNKTDSLFHIVDIATPRYIGQFGTRGGGPSDFSISYSFPGYRAPTTDSESWIPTKTDITHAPYPEISRIPIRATVA